MEIKYKGEGLSEPWNEDLTVGKWYVLHENALGGTFIFDDVGEEVFIGDFRLSEFEISEDR